MISPAAVPRERLGEVIARDERIRARRRGAVLSLLGSFVLFLLNVEFVYDAWLRYVLHASSLLFVAAAGLLWWHASVLERSRPSA